MSEPIHFMDVLRCTHGGDCPAHPDAQGLHDFTPTAAEALREVMAEFGAGTSPSLVVAVVAERLGVEL